MVDLRLAAIGGRRASRDKNGGHELYLMCDDVQAFIAQMKQHDVACAPVYNARWGLLTHVMLPGGSKLGVYEPRHARPQPMTVKTSQERRRTRTEKAREEGGQGFHEARGAGGEEAFAPPPEPPRVKVRKPNRLGRTCDPPRELIVGR